MKIDVSGLVESWVSEAEDWMLAYAGPGELTAREAFEGIECLGRLARCDASLMQEANGNEAFTQLKYLITNERTKQFAESAITFPNLDAWMRQAQEVLEEQLDFPETTKHLLLDLDAADFLYWFIESYSPSIMKASQGIALSLIHI